MSNALAIGAVTAVLKNLLDNAVVNEKLTNAVGPVKVTTLPPDRVKSDTNFMGLNLFLFHVQPNPAWRNSMLPSRDGAGTRLTNQPLALDLYYLLTAWGKEDFEAEILLGYAMQLFHEVPMISRDVIRKTFETDPVVKGNVILPQKYKDLAAAALADQFEILKITPHGMTLEEGSKLWSAFQVNFRPGVAYQVSVVLIESEAPKRVPAPVLVRNITTLPDIVPPFPTLLAVTPAANNPSARPGENVVLTGHHLAGSSVSARLRHPHAPALPDIGPLAAATATQATVPFPALPAVWPAGTYMLALVISQPGGDRVSNELPLAVAPVLNIAASSHVREADTSLTMTIVFEPEIRPLQTAELILGDVSAASDPHPAQTGTLVFRFPKAIAPAAGTYFVRLRIDGVESLLIDRTTVPPQFDLSQRITVT